MNDWVNCLRLVAFGSQPAPSRTASTGPSSTPTGQAANLAAQPAPADSRASRPVQSHATRNPSKPTCDVLLDKRPLPAASGDSRKDNKSPDAHPASPALGPAKATTASQAAASAAIALAKTRQRQPSLLGSCKPQPPTDSPFIRALSSAPELDSSLEAMNQIGQLDTMTPTVRGQLILAAGAGASARPAVQPSPGKLGANKQQLAKTIPATLDEEEENMLYCSIEDNPSEHNYRVKVIETELALRCQLKCYQLVAPTTVSQQYERLGQLRSDEPITTFYQLIIGPQELTLLNDYATSGAVSASNLKQLQGLWSWPYQCIRRYGFDKDNCFMFEAGRKCTSGPGQFIVQTPKAHSIYRDVVKFVNELRSLSSSLNETATPVNNNLQQLAEQPQKSGTVVTQIPVTWNPQQKPATNQGPPSTRQQFFDTLRQLEASQHQPEMPVCGTTKPQDPPLQLQNSMAHQLSSAQGASDDKPAMPVNAANGRAGRVSSQVSPDETDESGYEQGDDSVDSSRRPKAQLGPSNRRRQATNETMSSASSTASGGTSPPHSVSRRPGSKGISSDELASKHQKLTNKRPSLLNSIGLEQKDANVQINPLPTRPPPLPKKPDLSQSSADRLLSFRGANLSDVATRLEQQEDFETNLIRDVYSEITKLHAKFAVTRISAEDLMSSGNSSHDSSTSDNASSYLNNEQELDESANDSGDSARSSEPMYSNLAIDKAQDRRTPNVSGRQPDHRDGLLDDDLDEILDGGRSLCVDGNFKVSSQVMSRQRLLRQQSTMDLNSPTKGQCMQYYNQGGLDYLSTRSCGVPLYPSSLNPIPECGEVNGNQRWSSGSELAKRNAALSPSKRQVVSEDTNRMAAKHYLINDVQYARISRGLDSNYESCL